MATLILPAAAKDRELAGINPARCQHEWVRCELFIENPRTGERYVTATHHCRVCLLSGNEKPDTEFWRGWGAVPFTEVSPADPVPR